MVGAFGGIATMASRGKKTGKSTAKKASGKTRRGGARFKHFRPPVTEWVKPAYAQVNDNKWLLGLLIRLDEVVGSMSMNEISDKTGLHWESIRRYLKHGPPSAEFIKAVCEEFKVNADWLLLGRGKK